MDVKHVRLGLSALVGGFLGAFAVGGSLAVAGTQLQTQVLGVTPGWTEEIVVKLQFSSGVRDGEVRRRAAARIEGAALVLNESYASFADTAVDLRTRYCQLDYAPSGEPLVWSTSTGARGLAFRWRQAGAVVQAPFVDWIRVLYREGDDTTLRSQTLYCPQAPRAVQSSNLDVESTTPYDLPYDFATEQSSLRVLSEQPYYFEPVDVTMAFELGGQAFGERASGYVQSVIDGPGSRLNPEPIVMTPSQIRADACGMGFVQEARFALTVTSYEYAPSRALEAMDGSADLGFHPVRPNAVAVYLGATDRGATYWPVGCD
jgi:hypothetical protein